MSQKADKLSFNTRVERQMELSFSPHMCLLGRRRQSHDDYWTSCFQSHLGQIIRASYCEFWDLSPAHCASLQCSCRTIIYLFFITFSLQKACPGTSHVTHLKMINMIIQSGSDNPHCCIYDKLSKQLGSLSLPVFFLSFLYKYFPVVSQSQY